MFETLEEIEPKYAGIALLAGIGMALMVFSKPWASIALWVKIASIIFIIPITYVITRKIAEG